MSDARLRELERRWRESGSTEDEAAYLRERVRVGDLTQERLELAAYCGHEGALRATGVRSSPRLTSEGFIATLVMRHDRDIALLAAFAAAMATLNTWESLDWKEETSTRYRDSPRKALECFGRWFQSRRSEDLAALDQALRDLDSPMAGEWAPRAAEGLLGSVVNEEGWQDHLHASLANAIAAVGLDSIRHRIGEAAIQGVRVPDTR